MKYPAGTSACCRITVGSGARIICTGDGLGAGAAHALTNTSTSAAPDLTRSRLVTRRAARQNRQMRRIGHRGAMGHAPENTIDSFKKALELGCDEVETDVWLTQDGRLLISHDRPTKTTLSL